jgi:predicted AAA+ superfamily ATPase
LYSQIDFKERLIGIIGARGAGKTTLLLQYLKKQTNAKETLYLIGDHPLVASEGLFNIADAFQKVGGKVLIIDEIQSKRL